MFNDCDPIWEHPKTSAQVFVGGSTAASRKQILKSFRINRVVNCQDVKTKNYFQKDANFRYIRFPIASWWKSPFNMDTKEGVLRFFNPLFTFIEKETDKGKSVLIHCLAGAHRAGTTGVSWLMYADKLDVATAVKKAKKFRRAINPIGSFPELLKKLQRALREEGLMEKMREKSDVVSDLKKIVKNSEGIGF